MFRFLRSRLLVLSSKWPTDDPPATRTALPAQRCQQWLRLHRCRAREPRARSTRKCPRSAQRDEAPVQQLVTLACWSGARGKAASRVQSVAEREAGEAGRAAGATPALLRRHRCLAPPCRRLPFHRAMSTETRATEGWEGGWRPAPSGRAECSPPHQRPSPRAERRSNRKARPYRAHPRQLWLHGLAPKRRCWALQAHWAGQRPPLSCSERRRLRPPGMLGQHLPGPRRRGRTQAARCGGRSGREHRLAQLPVCSSGACWGDARSRGRSPNRFQEPPPWRLSSHRCSGGGCGWPQRPKAALHRAPCRAVETRRIRAPACW
mmetsp:Transcript_2807/g.11286  ORF Transcript_2807/g.11286 Transcript_2807/m.11286 type:complete len:320 (+) Transcript_2807:214-1173(+)